MPFDLRERLCLGARAVPHALFENAEVGEEEAIMNLAVLDFSSRAGDFEWIEAGLNLGARHFRQTEFALLEEIRAGIRGQRQGLRRREGVRERTFLELQVRGRTVIVQNTVRRLVVGFRPENLQADLGWLLGQLERDLEDPPAPPAALVLQDAGGDAGPIVVAGDGGYLGAADAAPPAAPAARAERDSLELQLRGDILAVMRAHPGCLGAFWCPSRFSFEVRKRAATGEPERHEVRVRGLANLRRGYDANPEWPDRRRRLTDAFQEARTKLLRRLEPEAPPQEPGAPQPLVDLEEAPAGAPAAAHLAPGAEGAPEPAPLDA